MFLQALLKHKYTDNVTEILTVFFIHYGIAPTETRRLNMQISFQKS